LTIPRWAESGDTVVLEVPSAVVPGEHDFLLNPRHPDFHRLTIGHPEPFDPRATPDSRTRVVSV
jgi:RES domain-containing protein